MPPASPRRPRIVADAGSQGVFIVDSAGAFLPDDVRRRIAAMRAALPDDVAIGIHEHNNLSLAVANTVAAIEEGATLVDISLAGLGAGAGNCQTEALVAVLERIGIETGIDLWTLQDVADDVVRGEIMQRPIVVDRLTATMGYAAVPASFLLHAIRAGERFGLDPREIIVELGKRQVVVGQEDVIIGVAAEMAATVDARSDHGRPRRRSHRHAGRERRAGGARLVRPLRLGRRAGGRAGGAPADQLARAHRRRGRRARCLGCRRRPAATSGRAPGAARRQHASGTSLGGVRGAAGGRPPGREDAPLLLVPALPAAGRITIGGRHLLERDGERVPLEETEYARDGAFAYSDSDLARWADERSGGRLAAADAVRIPLERLRRPAGANDIASAIAAAAAVGRPAVVIPDAETDADLRTIAGGLRAAEEARIAVIVRCAPAFAAVLTGAEARSPAPAPRGDRGLLVVCGSFVAGATAQLEALERAHPGTAVAADVRALAGADWSSEVDRLAAAARDRIEHSGLAVVATERRRDPSLVDPAAQRRIATALAQVARRVGAGVVVAKGGITSAVTARAGLDARVARVVGPIRPGVALWRLSDGTDYVIVPGNVGGDDLLADVVAAIGPRVPATAEPR